jgi:hypothetical protein
MEHIIVVYKLCISYNLMLCCCIIDLCHVTYILDCKLVLAQLRAPSKPLLRRQVMIYTMFLMVVLVPAVVVAVVTVVVVVVAVK